MTTFLFDEIVFGPVQSRRLGVSLGVNLLPTDSKICNFNCIYCECGWTQNSQSKMLPSRSEVRERLHSRLEKMRFNAESLDVITFAGNGEPTIHPDFDKIIDDTIDLRNKYYPAAQIAVLSNATMLHKPAIVNALMRVDQSILKLDSGFDSTLNLLNQPKKALSVTEQVARLKKMEGKFTLQTLFVRGIYNGQAVDNTTAKEIKQWLAIIQEIKPKEVMVYTIARTTPIDTLKKIPLSELESIAEMVRKMGIPVQVSG